MRWLGEIPYAQALRWMEGRRAAMLADPSLGGQLLLCSHPPVITLGTRATSSDLRISDAEASEKGMEIVRVKRGGVATYHDQGQLMVYPVVRVGAKVQEFLALLARILLDELDLMGLSSAHWQEDPAGLWMGPRKLAACGLHIHRGVSIHGFALNVSTEASAWHCINPCGFSASVPMSIREALLCTNRWTIPSQALSRLSVEAIAERVHPRLAGELQSYGLDRWQPSPIDSSLGTGSSTIQY